jgi:hypothetical protein
MIKKGIKKKSMGFWPLGLPMKIILVVILAGILILMIRGIGNAFVP